jgi:hypothetical protein
MGPWRGTRPARRVARPICPAGLRPLVCAAPCRDRTASLLPAAARRRGAGSSASACSCCCCGGPAPLDVPRTAHRWVLKEAGRERGGGRLVDERLRVRSRKSARLTFAIVKINTRQLCVRPFPVWSPFGPRPPQDSPQTAKPAAQCGHTRPRGRPGTARRSLAGSARRGTNAHTARLASFSHPSRPRTLAERTHRAFDRHPSRTHKTFDRHPSRTHKTYTETHMHAHRVRAHGCTNRPQAHLAPSSPARQFRAVPTLLLPSGAHGPPAHAVGLLLR